MKLLALLILLTLLALPAVALAAPPAQGDAPVVEPAPPVIDDTPSPLVEALTWAALLITTLGTWSAVVVTMIDASKARLIAWATLWGVKEDWPEFKAITTLLALALASWQAVTTLGYNIFTLPHAPAVFTNNSTAQQITSAIVLMGAAIALHEVVSWRKNVAIEAFLDFLLGDNNVQSPSA